MVTFASVQPDTTFDGYDYVDACRILADAGAAIVGLNCSRGPETMLPLLEQIRAAVDVAVAAQPVPYQTSPAVPAFESLAAEDGARLFPIQLERFQCTRFEMADFARRARDVGVDYIGICCGDRPAPRPRDGGGAGPRHPSPAATRPRSSCTRSWVSRPPTRSWAAGKPRRPPSSSPPAAAPPTRRPSPPFARTRHHSFVVGSELVVNPASVTVSATRSGAEHDEESSIWIV